MNINSKNGRNRSSSYESKASKSFIPIRGICLWCLIMKRKEIIICIQVFIPIKWRISILKMVEKEVFLMKPKRQYYLSQWEECVNSAQSWKKEIIMWIQVYPNWKRNFDSKMVENEVFLLKRMHQYHLSQWGECVYDVEPWK